MSLTELMRSSLWWWLWWWWRPWQRWLWQRRRRRWWWWWWRERNGGLNNWELGTCQLIAHSQSPGGPAASAPLYLISWPMASRLFYYVAVTSSRFSGDKRENEEELERWTFGVAHSEKYHPFTIIIIIIIIVIIVIGIIFFFITTSK